MATKKPAPKKKPARPQFDWEAIEREYRAGQLSIREIGKIHGPSAQAICKKAKLKGWKRDLAKKVRERVKEKLVDAQGDTPNADDNQIIDAAADRGAQVVKTHRKDINSAREVAGLLMAELRDGTENHELVSELVEQQADNENWDQRAKSAARRAISLPSRAGVLRDLATAMHKFQVLERQAFNLDDKGGDPDETDAMTQTLAAVAGSVIRPEG